jgi:uncharacterized protein YndB with AHSA1/START domain
MFKFLLVAAIVVGVIVICVLALAATKPARFTVQRSIVVQAVPEKVFALINDLRRWPEWSADDRDASTVRRTYSGAPAGKGAVCEWEGTGSAGKGRIEIVESSANMIRLQADWARPFAARNINIFTLEPQGNTTRITWTLDGENVFMLRVMTILVSADRLMGSHLERGLADLKSAAEK